MRLRSVSIFPEFDRADPDEKESYLEAAEILEQKGLLNLNWEKRGKGERLKTLNCADIGKLFEESGGRDPKTEAEEIRALFKNKAPALDGLPEPWDYKSLLNYFSEQFGPSEIGRGMDRRAAEDFVCLIDNFFGPAKLENMTTRALSVSLYKDSKRLEHLLDLFNPFLVRAKKQGIRTPDFSFLDRSYPETMISGKIIFEYENNGNDSGQPLINANGFILGFPFSHIREMRTIRTIDAKENPKVLTIENKETFYALAEPHNHGKPDSELSRYDCFLYTGGYPNQAAAALIKLLAASGFCFYHAGDLDPDGILILQELIHIAGKPITPLRMDAATFDRYAARGKKLEASVMRRLSLIREETIPGIAALIKKIEETGVGVEQEIIDYTPN